MTPRGREGIVAAAGAPDPGRPPRYDVLFDRIRLGPLVTKNRFYQTPHCTSLGTQRPRAQAALREVKAQGGWAVVCTEYCSIHPECDDSPWIAARLWDDGDVRNLRAMTEAVHRHDSLAGVQLWYGGAVGTNLETRLPARGVSQIACDQFPDHGCYEMTTSEIGELRGFYVAAARRAIAAGFDIIVIGAQEVDNIFTQFLMPFYNHRRDEYGGGLENRARFLLETVESVRGAVPARCAVTVRLCIDTLDGTERGIRADVEGRAVIEMADPLVDFWDVQVGGWGSEQWGNDPVPARSAGENFQGRWIQAVRSATAKPVVGVGRFTSPDTMVDVIGAGQQDLIGAARPSIADPFLPAKIEQGRFDEIRECIGCNICVSRHGRSVPIICTQNPTLGEEHRRGWHPEHVPAARNAHLPVLIVGAGPAGLECAVTLAKRGFERVHLVDAQPEAGGALRWMSGLPGLAAWSRVVDYRTAQIAKLANVDLIPHTKLTAAGVLDYGAAIVIIAAGSRWAADGLNWATHDTIPGAGGGSAHVFTPEQILLEGKPLRGEKVVVYDCDGYVTGVGLAELLRRQGLDVEILTPFPALAPGLEHTYEAAAVAERLEALGVRFTAGVVVDEITAEHVVTSRVVHRDRRTTAAADSVVLVTQRISDGLYRELEASPERLRGCGVQALFRIGDCVVPRLVADAVFDGHRLAREIDTADPSVPLPFIREMALI